MTSFFEQVTDNFFFIRWMIIIEGSLVLEHLKWPDHHKLLGLLPLTIFFTLIGK